MDRYIYKDVCGEACPAKFVCAVRQPQRRLLFALFLSLRSSASCLMKMYDAAPPQTATAPLRQPATASRSVPQSATVPQPAIALPLLTALLLQGQQQRLLWWATRWRRDLPCRTGPAGVP